MPRYSGAYRDDKDRIRPITPRKKSKAKTGVPIRLKTAKKVQKYNPKEMKMGMLVELEHSDITGGDPILTRKIVIAHLKEDPQYYTKLKQVEENRSPKHRISATMYPTIKNDILGEYPLKEEYPDLYAIGIFGSQVYGSPKVDSDVDVLVVFDTKDWRYHSDLPLVYPYMDRAEESLTHKLGRKVEITRMTRIGRWEDFIPRGESKDDFIEKVHWVYDPHQYYSTSKEKMVRGV